MSAVEHPVWCVGPPQCPVSHPGQYGAAHIGPAREVRRNGRVVASAAYRLGPEGQAQIMPRCNGGLTAEEAITFGEELIRLGQDLPVLS